LKTKPCLQSIQQSTALYSLIQSRFGELDYFKWLRYEAKEPRPGAILTIFQDEEAAEAILKSSPLRCRIEIGGGLSGENVVNCDFVDDEGKVLDDITSSLKQGSGEPVSQGDVGVTEFPVARVEEEGENDFWPDELSEADRGKVMTDAVDDQSTIKNKDNHITGERQNDEIPFNPLSPKSETQHMNETTASEAVSTPSSKVDPPSPPPVPSEKISAQSTTKLEKQDVWTTVLQDFYKPARHPLPISLPSPLLDSSAPLPRHERQVKKSTVWPPSSPRHCPPGTVLYVDVTAQPSRYAHATHIRRNKYYGPYTPSKSQTIAQVDLEKKVPKGLADWGGFGSQNASGRGVGWDFTRRLARKEEREVGEMLERWRSGEKVDLDR